MHFPYEIALLQTQHKLCTIQVYILDECNLQQEPQIYYPDISPYSEGMVFYPDINDHITHSHYGRIYHCGLKALLRHFGPLEGDLRKPYTDRKRVRYNSVTRRR